MKKIIIITCLLFTCLLQAQVIKYRIETVGIRENLKNKKSEWVITRVNNLLVYNNAIKRISAYGDPTFHWDIIKAIKVEDTSDIVKNIEDKIAHVLDLKLIDENGNLQDAILIEYEYTKEVFITFFYNKGDIAYSMYRIEN